MRTGTFVVPWVTAKFASFFLVTTSSLHICCDVRRTAAMLMLFGPPGRTISWMACSMVRSRSLRNFHSPVASSRAT